MSMRCKNCGEPFPVGKAYDLFELRRSHILPTDADAFTSTVHMEDAGVFCSRKCISDYLKSGDKSGLFDLGSVRARLDPQK